MINYSMLTDVSFYSDYYGRDGMVSLQDSWDYFCLDIIITVGKYVSIRSFYIDDSGAKIKYLEPNEIWPKLFLQGFVV